MSTPTPSTPDVQAQADTYQQQSASLRAMLTAALLGMWAALGTWHERDVPRFVSQARPLVQAGQRQMGAMTSAHLSSVLRQMGAATAPAPTPTGALTDLRQGVTFDEVYARPFRQVWTALGDGKPLEQAVQAGAQRLESLAATDVQLAKTHTAQAVLTSTKHVVGYQRVLEGPHSCGLCVVASTVRYHKADLLPIHPGCDCSVLPIVGDEDPGRTINEQRLADAHQAIAETFGKSSPGARANGRIPAYKDVLIVHQHGELGPVLGVRGQHFDGPSVH